MNYTYKEKGGIYIEFIFSLLFVLNLVLAMADIARFQYTKSILRFNLTKALKSTQATDKLFIEV